MPERASFDRLDRSASGAGNAAVSSELDELLALESPFADRHIGPSDRDIADMLASLGLDSLETLIDRTVPAAIRSQRSFDRIGAAQSEYEVRRELKAIASQNQVTRAFIGMGYANCITPPVIQRNILENPGWYTQYTPYQAEIAQGRLEALLNFQTMVADLTGMALANASLLDEGTAAAEAMTAARSLYAGKGTRFFVAETCHPQTIAVVRTRAQPLGFEVVVGDPLAATCDETYFGLLLQYPDTYGTVSDYRDAIAAIHHVGGFAIVAADLLSLTLLRPPGEFGADLVVGSTQRFGVPLGYGGPHAAYFAAKDAFRRRLPGRIVGVSKDAQGNPALRLALQTREQHIRREKATSNICTAQVLLAVIASTYAVYHGPEGLRRIARRIHLLTKALALGLHQLGYRVAPDCHFDTLRVDLGDREAAPILAQLEERQIDLRPLGDRAFGISLDETTTRQDLADLLACFGGENLDLDGLLHAAHVRDAIGSMARTSPYLTHPVFHRYHSETELLRYLHRLQRRDLSLTEAMIPLGSCTMKLNATTEMVPVTWPEFAQLHPFVPLKRAGGYLTLFAQLEAMLAEITGFDAVSLQPNAGSQGEYAGLLVIRQYHRQRGDTQRTACLIPTSAHGTNPASAVMAGMEVVPVACDREGNIDLADLETKARHYGDRLAALMVTYPSTHGVFEEGIRTICDIVHRHGGQVYMDGANLNAQVGLCRPADFGADVCHLNLHKTFCIPHGGGGPGVGPIAVKSHLAPYLPSHPFLQGTTCDRPEAIGPISAAPWGSASLLPISWAYVRLMGASGLRRATEVAILNANYIAHRLAPHYPILYTGREGCVAHECIIDLRALKTSAGIEVDDIAKRLMDYGFHAPTVSWPVAGTMTIEPTESETKAELDRFCEALIAIRAEIAEIESGKADCADNLLKGSPHTALEIADPHWSHPYSRDRAAFPTPHTRQHKFWPAVSRIDNAYGDRHLVCACLPMAAYTEGEDP